MAFGGSGGKSNLDEAAMRKIYERGITQACETATAKHNIVKFHKTEGLGVPLEIVHDSLKVLNKKLKGKEFAKLTRIATRIRRMAANLDDNIDKILDITDYAIADAEIVLTHLTNVDDDDDDDDDCGYSGSNAPTLQQHFSSVAKRLQEEEEECLPSVPTHKIGFGSTETETSEECTKI